MCRLRQRSDAKQLNQSNQSKKNRTGSNGTDPPQPTPPVLLVTSCQMCWLVPWPPQPGPTNNHNAAVAHAFPHPGPSTPAFPATLQPPALWVSLLAIYAVPFAHCTSPCPSCCHSQPQCSVTCCTCCQNRRGVPCLSVFQCCSRLLCHIRIAVVEVQLQHLTPGGLTTRTLHSK